MAHAGCQRGPRRVALAFMQPRDYTMRMKTTASTTLFGARLVQARERANLTRSELARRAGTSRQYLWRLETGKQDPSWELVRNLAAALGLSTDYFL